MGTFPATRLANVTLEIYIDGYESGAVVLFFPLHQHSSCKHVWRGYIQQRATEIGDSKAPAACTVGGFATLSGYSDVLEVERWHGGEGKEEE